MIAWIKLTIIMVLEIFVCVSCKNLLCNNNCIIIGIIGNGSNVEEIETLSKYEIDIVFVKHLIDTTQTFQLARSVHILDSNPNVDVILLLDYDRDVLRIPNILITQHKQLIKLGARATNICQRNSTQNERTKTCDSSASEYVTDEKEDVDCVTNLNITNRDRDDILMIMPVPNAVRNIVISLKWRSVILFYESSTEVEISQLVDRLSKDRVVFAMFDIDKVKDALHLLTNIYDTKRDVKDAIGIVLMCRFGNAKTILKAANKFDILNHKKTLLTMSTRWLVALYDYSRKASNLLKNYSRKLDNVVILAVPRFRNLNIQAVYNGVESSLVKSVREGIVDASFNSFRKRFISRLEKDAKSWSPTCKCKGYHIDTLLWTSKGRAFNHIGYADIDGNVVTSSDIFPNTKYGYNRRSFLVSTLPYAPFVMKKLINNTYFYEGFCMDLLNELANKLNFTYTLTEAADGKWGGLSNKENLTFNGLVGQLQREEVDIVAAPISVQAERESVMDYSYPFFYEYTTVLVKKPDANATKWRTLIDPFKWEVFVALGASVLAVTVIFYLLEKHNPFYDLSSKQRSGNRQIKGTPRTLGRSFWHVFGALFCQGGVHLPESTAGRTLMSCWWLTCLITVGTYCGNLIAFLTVTKEKPPFNSLHEMNKLKGTYKWGTIGGTIWEWEFPNSSHSAFRATGEAFIEFNKTDPSVLHLDPDFHVNRVKEGKYAWIGDKTYIEIVMATECSLMKIKEEFMPLIYVFGFKDKSSHAAIFSDQMIKIHEGGLLQIWKRKWWPKSSFCAGNSITEAKPISLMDVQSAFYAIVIGLGLSMIAFLIEVVLNKYRLYMRNSSQTNLKNKAKSIMGEK